MKKTFIITGILAGALSIVGCGDKGGDSETDGGTTTTSAGPTSDSDSTGDMTTGGTDTTTTGNPTGGETDSTTDTTGNPTTGNPTTTTDSTTDDPFIMMPDGQGPVVDCSTYDEDCDDGQKCMPWADDGGSSWNALKCVDVTGEGVHGDPCMVEGSGVSGNDDCALHNMCWDVDPETNMGNCISFCDGTPENASCDEPNTVCVIANEGVLNICLPSCKPLIQDCPEGQGCYPINNSYTCAPTSVPDDTGIEGDPCEFVNACQKGFACINAEQVPNCNMSSSCCSPFCDLTEQDPCPNPETQCIAVYEDNQSDPNVGFCGVMQ